MKKNTIYTILFVISVFFIFSAFIWFLVRDQIVYNKDTYLMTGVKFSPKDKLITTAGLSVKGSLLKDLIPPTVSIKSPSNNAIISGTVLVSASASDNKKVKKVEFYRNTNILIGTDTSSPYSINWDTTSVTDGSYTLFARAYDAAGNIGTSTKIIINVSNTTTTTTPLWVSAYLASWELNIPNTTSNWGSYTVNEIDWSAFTHLIFFATNINADGTCCAVGAPNTNWNDLRLKTIVNEAHRRNKPILFSVGGAGTGGWYSALSNPSTRTALVNNLVNFMNIYQFDGIDLDPEENSQWGQFIPAFAQELRAKLNQQFAYYDNTKRPILTAAIYNNRQYWAQAAPYFDQINIMSYDLTGTWWKETWHNNAAENVKNPDGSCATVDIAEGNANTCMSTVESKIKEAIKDGIPKNKLGAGIDFNGWLWQGGTILGGTNGPITPRDRWGTDPVQKSVLTNCSLGSKVESRYYAIKKCYLDVYPNSIKWDNLSKVSYFSLDNPGNTNDIYITYQDANSIKNIVNVIKREGIGGMILWEIGGGYLGKNNFPDAQYPGLLRDELLQTVKQAVWGL